MAAVIDALKEREVFASVKCDYECFVGEHVSKESDSISLFKMGDAKITKRYFLFFLDSSSLILCKGDRILQNLSVYCKEIECLKFQSSSFYFEGLGKQPNLRHFKGRNIDIIPVSQLLYSFPSLTCIKTSGKCTSVANVEGLKIFKLHTVLCSSLKKCLSHTIGFKCLMWEQYRPEGALYSKLPTSLFKYKNELEALTLDFAFTNVTQVLQVVSAINPCLKELKVSRVTGPLKKEVTDIISTSMPTLEFLYINNEAQLDILYNRNEDRTFLDKFYEEELQEFAERNTVDGKLRLRFTLE